MTKTKKNVQKKRRLQKKSRGFGKGKGANSAYARAATAASNSNQRAYKPKEYTITLGDNNSNFKYTFETDPKEYGQNIVDEIFYAIMAKRPNTRILGIFDIAESVFNHTKLTVYVPKSEPSNNRSNLSRINVGF